MENQKAWQSEQTVHVQTMEHLIIKHIKTFKTLKQI